MPLNCRKFRWLSDVKWDETETATDLNRNQPSRGDFRLNASDDLGQFGSRLPQLLQNLKTERIHFVKEKAPNILLIVFVGWEKRT